MRKTTKLKQLLNQRRGIPVGGVYDAMSAILAQEAGFEVVQISGYGFSASSIGLTDYSFTALADVEGITRNIVNAVDLPVMTDADTGYGNAVNVWHTTRRLEQTGAAGMNLEDQMLPKRCGMMQGKTLISLEEMVGKIRAAADARIDRDFVINARCDAIGCYGIDEAIRRGKAYAEAGADMVYIESPESMQQIERAVREIPVPVSVNLLEGGNCRDITLEQLRKAGVGRVSLPMFSTFVTAQALRDGFRYLMEHGTSLGYEGKYMDFSEYQRLTSTLEVRSMEEKYLK